VFTKGFSTVNLQFLLDISKALWADRIIGIFSWHATWVKNICECEGLTRGSDTRAWHDGLTRGPDARVWRGGLTRGSDTTPFVCAICDATGSCRSSCRRAELVARVEDLAGNTGSYYYLTSDPHQSMRRRGVSDAWRWPCYLAQVPLNVITALRDGLCIHHSPAVVAMMWLAPVSNVSVEVCAFAEVAGSVRFDSDASTRRVVHCLMGRRTYPRQHWEHRKCRCDTRWRVNVAPLSTQTMLCPIAQWENLWKEIGQTRGRHSGLVRKPFTFSRQSLLGAFIIYEFVQSTSWWVWDNSASGTRMNIYAICVKS